MSARRSTNKRTQRSSLGPRAPATTPRASRRAPVLLAALLILTLGLAPRAEAVVYWATNTADGTIGRANLDGTGVEQSFITAADYPSAVAVDSEHVYWTNAHTDTIGRANVDGTDVNQNFITGANVPEDVAVGPAHVYWANWADGTIGRANVDGTGVDQNFIVALPVDSEGTTGVAVDALHVYWADQQTGAIGRANLDGTDVDRSFITADFLVPTGVAVDGEHVYWSTILGDGTIARANLDGTDVDQSFITGAGGFPAGLAVDGTHVYWGTRDFGHSNAIGRANLDGTGVDQSFIRGEYPEFFPTGVAVDALPFGLRRVTKNKERGTAKLTVKVSAPGELQLARNKKVKPEEKLVEAAGKVKLPIKPRRKAKQNLAPKGKAKVKAEITYTPRVGAPYTRNKKIKLIKR